MHRSRVCLLAIALVVSTTAHAAIIQIDSVTPDLAGAIATPGRQIVGGAGGGPVIPFDPATDVFVFNQALFGLNQIDFVNADSSLLPTTGYNVAVVQDVAPLAAGVAATRIANQLTTPGPGFFVYFNSGLNLPRLVYSTDLSDPLADLAIIAQMPNLSGVTGPGLAQFTAANFAVPEPATWLLMSSAVAALGWRRRRRGASTT